MRFKRADLGSGGRRLREPQAWPLAASPFPLKLFLRDLFSARQPSQEEVIC